MARVQVVSDDGRTTVDVITSEGGWTVGWCRVCLETMTDRGHFEDTVQASEVHVDQEH